MQNGSRQRMDPVAAAFDAVEADLLNHGCDADTVGMCLNEARFGYGLMAPVLSDQGGHPMRILEIGAGSGILSYVLARRGHQVDAVEPIGLGFSKTRPLLRAVSERAAQDAPGFRHHDVPIEAYRGEQAADVAVSINVFEHLDVASALGALKRCLGPEGVAVIAFPNYTIPYESHYGLPILGSKRMTHAVFHKRIAAFDEAHHSEGLWDSLNFLTARRFARLTREHGLRLRWRKGVTRMMFDRAVDDPQFRARHEQLAGPILTARRLGLPRMADALPVAVQPYVVAEVRPESGGRSTEKAGDLIA